MSAHMQWLMKAISSCTSMASVLYRCAPRTELAVYIVSCSALLAVPPPYEALILVHLMNKCQLIIFICVFLEVIGMHFMNPPPIMKLIEIIKGEKTSQETFEVTRALAAHLGKTFCVSADRPGFIVNRILMPMINEAFFALMEGVATAEDIDVGMRLGTNQPMGPLLLADFIGLDTCLAIIRVLHDGLGSDKYRPCPLLVRYVSEGRLGKKSGRGVYFHKKSPKK